MAYDEEVLPQFDEFRNIAALFERFFAAPENIAVAKLLALVRATHRISAGRGEDVSLRQLATGLRGEGLGSVPLDTVVRVLEAVTKIPEQEDVLALVTLRDVQRFTSR